MCICFFVLRSNATVFQSDIVGFTKLCSTLKPSDVCCFLHDLYQRYDEFSQLRGVEKIETIGFVCFFFSLCIFLLELKTKKKIKNKKFRDAYICVQFDDAPDPILHFAVDVLQIHKLFRKDYTVKRNVMELRQSINLSDDDKEEPKISVDVRGNTKTHKIY